MIFAIVAMVGILDFIGRVLKSIDHRNRDRKYRRK